MKLRKIMTFDEIYDAKPSVLLKAMDRNLAESSKLCTKLIAMGYGDHRYTDLVPLASGNPIIARSVALAEESGRIKSVLKNKHNL